MRTTLTLFVLILFASTSLSFSQTIDKSDKNKTINYYLISKTNDTIVFTDKVMPTETFICGFNYYSNGKFIRKINPELYKYLIYKNTSGETIKLKSLPRQKKIRFCDYKNVFMQALIENSDEDLKKGKVDFYATKFTDEKKVINSYDDSGISKSNMNYESLNFYLKDVNGIKQINYKFQFKKLKKVLGKQVYREMIRSDKGEKQFLIDYLTQYNKAI